MIVTIVCAVGAAAWLMWVGWTARRFADRITFPSPAGEGQGVRQPAITAMTHAADGAQYLLNRQAENDTRSVCGEIVSVEKDWRVCYTEPHP
jgi:hypothetical protein